VLRPPPRRNSGERWSLVIPSCAEQKHPFADQTLFSGKFAASLGPELGHYHKTEEPSRTFRLLSIPALSQGYK